ncbi:MAG TPA: hypothetical protein VJK25_03470 [Patescibacteria group bacterium]|nr:hypothetical protein [Patescibacteria group bacterium]
MNFEEINETVEAEVACSICGGVFGTKEGIAGGQTHGLCLACKTKGGLGNPEVQKTAREKQAGETGLFNHHRQEMAQECLGIIEDPVRKHQAKLAALREMSYFIKENFGLGLNCQTSPQALAELAQELRQKLKS